MPKKKVSKEKENKNTKEKKTITRAMLVTMPEEDFLEFDQGITHSDGGIRTKDGKLSVLPDIAPLEPAEKGDESPSREELISRLKEFENTEDDELSKTRSTDPAREKIDIVQSVQNTADILGILADLITNHPEIVAWVIKGARLTKSFFSQKYSTIKSRIESRKLIKANQLSNAGLDSERYEIEVINSNQVKMIISEEQAELLINEMRKKARELTSMIYLLSNIVIRDEKKDTDNVLEESFLRQLLSEESTNTMKALVSYKQLLDEETVVCFEDWLNGYLRVNEQRISIPVLRESNASDGAKEMEKALTNLEN